jgi:N-acetylmuramoyl-L-alanine amidase
MRWFALIVTALIGTMDCSSERQVTHTTHRHGSRPAPVFKPIVRDRIEEARQLQARMRTGELPSSVDQVAQSLVYAAESGAQMGDLRADDAYRMASSLMLTRFRLTRDRQDLRRAERWFDRLSVRGDLAGCDLLGALADGLHGAGETLDARTRYLQYERLCPQGQRLAHVHATLALLDPALARAASDEAASQRSMASRAVRSVRARRIVIDPGHGGSDPGARGPGGMYESSITLDVARRLADRVASELGLEVVLTRDADVYVPLEARWGRANDSGADLFISIHCNSSENSNGRGLSTYVLDANSDQIAARVAARENASLNADPWADPEVFRILADLRLLGHRSRSRELAEIIQRSMVSELSQRYGDIQDLGVHPARFAVLVGARMPAVLVELFFLSNPVEGVRLSRAAHRDELAAALTHAIGEAIE